MREKTDQRRNRVKKLKGALCCFGEEIQTDNNTNSELRILSIT